MTRHSSGLAKKKVGLQFSFHEVLADGEETPLVVICITRASCRDGDEIIVKGCVIIRQSNISTLTAPLQGAGQLLATCKAVGLTDSCGGFFLSEQTSLSRRGCKLPPAEAKINLPTRTQLY